MSLDKDEFNIIMPERASKDILAIVGYIKKVLCAPMAAINVLDKIEEQVQKLEQFPFRHPQYCNKFWDNEPVRFVPVDNYIIFYIVKKREKAVIIYRVAYGKMDTNKL